MDIEAFRKAGYAAIDRICDYYATLAERPVKAEVKPGYLINALPDHPPEQGEDFEVISSEFEKHVLPGITHWQHGKFTAYFPSISTFESMIGELYTASVSNPGFNWICSPACTELEQVVLDWCANLFDLHPDFYIKSKRGGGVIITTASEVVLTVAIAARERALRILSEKEPDVEEGVKTGRVPDSDTPMKIREKYGQRLVIYGSTHTHSLGAKAALLLGLQWKAVPVSAADNYSLRGDALRRVIEEDIANGLVPFFVIGTVGTTNTGAVDRIAEIGQVCRDYPTLFFHVDAAWAGVAYSVPSLRESLRHAEVNEYADSFCTNMHKWGLVGFDCSLLYVRNRQTLTSAMSMTPFYLRSKESEAGEVIDYRNWQLALGRRFRSPKLWFVLRSFGVSGFQKHIQRGVELSSRLGDMIRSSARFELVTPQSLSMVVFRLNPGQSPNALASDDLNKLNSKLSSRLDHRSDVFITPAMLGSEEGNMEVLRIQTGGYRTTMEDVLAVWKVVEEEGEALLRERE
ncbi:putative aromatic-L-amino-acid decarboxylase [Kockovaella imperatae]|uniref:Putative aromatic-L-amino-acid decarboxylase n=1 Tax=Kockovaella imperatae TaxID=4999 RepID=A0A1Y1U904_9TREE|nr:putative aromatic-L-amino-acid decarboxylase [Kockovaella imperatae]ORX34523.1 putative aromatic-L-amino-acid decarboxylase [Kockovaella imperatae]